MERYFLINHRSERLEQLKKKRPKSFVVLTIAFVNAKVCENEGHPDLNLFESIITSSECNLDKTTFKTAINFLERTGDFQIIHKGHKDTNSIFNLRNKSRNVSSINGTIVKCISRDIYEFLSLEEILKNENRFKENPSF